MLLCEQAGRKEKLVGRLCEQIRRTLRFQIYGCESALFGQPTMHPTELDDRHDRSKTNMFVFVRAARQTD